MLLNLVLVGLVGVIVYNLFGDKIKVWVKSKMSPSTAATVVAITNTTTKNDATALIHSGVDCWIHLRSLPSIMADPAAIAALDTLKSSILSWTPVVEEKK